MVLDEPTTASGDTALPFYAPQTGGLSVDSETASGAVAGGAAVAAAVAVDAATSDAAVVGAAAMGATTAIEPSADPIVVLPQRKAADSVEAINSQKAQKTWPVAGLSNTEAIEMLSGANSGLRPDLSRHGYRVFKRVFDICASGLGIVVLFIPAVVLSVAICFKSPGAGPFYSQVRVGRLKKDGTYSLFRMWKFRSMVPNADALLKNLQDKNEADGPLFKIKDDPRIIPGLGNFIRKHSIDELPQLFNVFCGQMSLIGPRPALPVEVVAYSDRAKRRLTVKPGCGGAWQAGNRSDSTFDEMVELDLLYVDHCSLSYDAQLIKSTAEAMIVGEGAY